MLRLVSGSLEGRGRRMLQVPVGIILIPQQGSHVGRAISPVRADAAQKNQAQRPSMLFAVEVPIARELHLVFCPRGQHCVRALGWCRRRGSRAVPPGQALGLKRGGSCACPVLALTHSPTITNTYLCTHFCFPVFTLDLSQKPAR